MSHPTNTPKFDNDTEHTGDFTLSTDLDAAQIASLEVVFTTPGSDEWHMFGFTAYGRTLLPTGQDTCLVRNSTKQTLNNIANNIPFATGTSGGCP